MGTPTPADVAANTKEAAPDVDTTETTVEKKEYTPPATQEDLDAIIQERVARERKKYSDYPKLKKIEQEWNELQDAQKSVEEKLSDENSALKEKLKSLQRLTLANDIAAEFKLTPQVVGMLNGADEEELRGQAKILADLFAEYKKPKAPGIPGLGSQITTASGSSDFPPRDAFY